MEANEGLDAMETGTVIHEVFARATWAARQAAPHGTWDLFYDTTVEGAKDALVEKTVDVLKDRLHGALEEACELRPSMSRALLDRVGERWVQALSNWVGAHVQGVPPSDPAAVGPTPAVMKWLKEIAELEEAGPWIDQLEQKISLMLEDGKKLGEMDKVMQERTFPGQLRRKNFFTQPLRDIKKAGKEQRPALWQALRDLAAQDLEQWRRGLEQAWEEARADARDAWVAARPGRAAYAELALGYEELKKRSDPRSVVGPLTLAAGGEQFRFRGEIDRVDWDPDRRLWAIRDYKSGKRVNQKPMTNRARLGFQLQLALYNLALEALVEAGHLPQLSGGKGHLLSLEYPKATEPSSRGPGIPATTMSLEEPAPLTLDGEPASWCDIAAVWAGHHVRGIRGGLFPLLPAHCPMEEDSAYCDYERVCGYSPESRETLAPPQEPPRVEAVVQEPKGNNDDVLVHPTLLPPRAEGDETDHEQARRQLSLVQQAVCDLDHDVIISAGAGTGKTYNLVLRYLTALAEGLSPQQILCITFTRKAAAEMAHRVRHALLSVSDDIQQPLVDRIKADPARYRQILLTLSAAPISTIDSLALRIIKEAEAIRAARRGGDTPALEPSVVAPSEVQGALDRFVSDRYLQGVDGGDPRLTLLLQAITPGHLRTYLFNAVKAHNAARKVDDAGQVLGLWDEICQAVVGAVTEEVGRLDLAQGERLFEEAKAAGTKLITGPGVTRVGDFLDAARRLSGDPDLPLDRALIDAATVALMPLRKGMPVGVKAGDLCDWLLREVIPILHRSKAPTTEAAGLLKEMKNLPGGSRDLKNWGAIAGAAGELVQEWDQAFALQLQRQGRLRYQDAERAATRALSDPALTDALRQRFPFEHLFMDESQDTSEGQVALVRSLGELCKATQFWVGDVKQSIYRFRGAEVDMFQRVLEGKTLPEARLVNLTVNWRSSAPLIRSFNRLFSALLPARRDGAPQDPGSEMTYEALGWPEQRDKDPAEAAVTLIAQPGEGWVPKNNAQREETAPNNQVEEPDNQGGDQLQRAMIQQLLLLLKKEEMRREEAEKRGAAKPRRGPDAAILVHSWARATLYRDLLSYWGIPAEVQGGRGLLVTEEVDHLMQWLEAALLASRIGLLGTLRWPGIGISDAGLVCLKHGYGTVNDSGEPVDGTLSPRALAFLEVQLDPDLALQQWAEETGEDTSGLLPTLQADAAMFGRWLALYQAFGHRCAAGDLSGAVEELLDEADLRAWWNKRERGPDRLANLASFLDYLREMEETGGAPAEVVRALLAQKDSDDPAAGGLGGDLETRVCITTYFQAKGREWPVVVIPDLHKYRISVDKTGLSAVRVVPPGSNDAVYLPLVSETPKETPFKANCPEPITALTNLWRMPAERAEMRRLFYVALTRAKRHLLLSGVFSRPKVEDSLPHPGGLDQGMVYTLGQANNWASTLMVGLNLRFNERGEVEKLSGGAWSDEDICLPCPARLAGALKKQTDNRDEPSRVVLGPRDMAAWTPVTSEDDPLLSPSDLHGEAPPEPTEVLGSWPQGPDPSEHLLQVNSEGTALHEVLEEWGYRDREELTGALVRKVLDRQDLRPEQSSPEVARNILNLARTALAQRPELVAELRDASEGGDVYHEIPFRYRDSAGGLMNGVIDLLWRDQAGWHILDYKAGSKAIDFESPLASANMKKHHAQVLCYADAVTSLTGEKPVDYGIWYTSYGLVVRWRG